MFRQVVRVSGAASRAALWWFNIVVGMAGGGIAELTDPDGSDTAATGGGAVLYGLVMLVSVR